VILNNLEYDHADIFPDLHAIETQFHHLLRTVPSQGRIIRPAQDDALDRVLARGCWTPVDTVGSGGDWTAQDTAEATSFVVQHGGKEIPLHWSHTGEHNRLNALAALAAAHHVGVPLEAGVAALAEFQGVKRRMELRGTVKGGAGYDDFAHHPTAIATTLAGVRRQVGTGRILAVLEPRS